MAQCIEAASLRGCAGIRHGFFTRRGGVSGGAYASLNCGSGSGDRPADVARNRELVAARLAVTPALPPGATATAIGPRRMPS